MWKKITAVLVIQAMVLALAACGEAAGAGPSTRTDQNVVSAGTSEGSSADGSASTGAGEEKAEAGDTNTKENRAAGNSGAGEGSTSATGSGAREGSTSAAAGSSAGDDGEKTEAAGADASGGESAAAGTTGEETAAVSRGLIVIDPGHQQYANTEQEPVGPGASETKIKVSGGTSGVATGVPEYQLTLEIGLQLREELEARGYTVIMVRETNEVNISNSERAAVANEADADAFVRIHANGGDSSATGAMTICQTPGNVYNGDLYEESRALSDCILQAYTEKTGIRPEYVWETDTMSGINWCRVPVTIVEMGYMTNSEEDRKMQDPDMQKRMTEGIADGIDAYMADHPAKERASENATPGAGQTVPLSPEMEALDKHLQEMLADKAGTWSLYLSRMDTGEEVRIRADEPMISASLIKLYIAGCYLDRVEREEISDTYGNQLSAMLSASDNGAANTLIDALGQETINHWMQENEYAEGQLNRRMLEKNGTENYTSAADCGRFLTKVYQGICVSKEASGRIMEAMKSQIDRNRDKIPAGIPDGVETANKTGELITVDAEGTGVDVQNDAAVIFADGHPYVLVVMSAVPGAGEGELRSQIAELSAEVYKAVCQEQGR